MIKPVKTSFKEFVKWNLNRDTGKQEKFWKEYLADFDTNTELPIKSRKAANINTPPMMPVIRTPSGPLGSV